MKIILLSLVLGVSCTQNSNIQISSNQVQSVQKQSDREHDRFVGNVKKVSIEFSPISGVPVRLIPTGKKCPVSTDVYDENGRLIQHSLYSGICGTTEKREDYIYSPDGSRTEKPTGNDSRQSKRMFKYDSSGKRTEEVVIDESGDLIYKLVFLRNAKVQWNEMDDYDERGKLAVRRVYDFTGDQPAPSGFTYYGQNNKIYEKTLYSDYEFNSQGDWIKRKDTTEDESGKHVTVTFRQIEYYPDKK